MTPDTSEFTPLPPAALHIMMALAGQDLHGYGIMHEISEQSKGRYKLGPGTLYDNLQRLLEQGLVQEVHGRAADDPRRRYYRLSGLGKTVLKEEILRLEAVLKKTKLQLLGKTQLGKA